MSFSYATTADPTDVSLAAIGTCSWPSLSFVVVSKCELLNPINSPGMVPYNFRLVDDEDAGTLSTVVQLPTTLPVIPQVLFGLVETRVTYKFRYAHRF